MASVFDTSVDRDQQRADQLLELVKWASGLRGAQTLGRAYSGPIADAYNRTLGHPAMQPGGAVQGATQNLPPVGPFAIAKGLGALPMVLGARGTGLTSGAAGMHGADVFDKLFRKIEMMGRSIAKTQQDIPDVVQAGNEAVVKRMATAKGPGLSGIEATKIARGAEKNYRPANTQAVGSRRVDKRLVEKVEAMMGDQGHDKWVEKLRELDPKGGWTLGRLRDVQSGKPQAVSLDKLKPGKAGEGMLGMQLRSDDNPELWARVREVAKGLKGAMKRDAEDLIAGRKDASELHPQTLQRLRGAFSEFSPESAKTPAAAKIVSRGGKPLDPETDKVVNWLQDKPIGAAEQLMVEDVKKAPQRSKGFKSKPIPVPKPNSVGAAAARPFANIDEFGRSQELKREVNDYARFVMGNKPGLERDVDPNMIRQFEASQNMNGAKETHRALDRAGAFPLYEDLPENMPHLLSSPDAVRGAPIMSMKTQAYDPDFIANEIRRRPEEEAWRQLNAAEIAERRARYNRLSGYPPTISGGSTAQPDPNIPPDIFEFPPHAFRNELRRQPAQQFGDEGFRNLSSKDRDIAAVVGNLDREQAAEGMSGGFHPGYTGQRRIDMMEGMTNNEAADMGDQFLKLRSFLGQLGRFTGRN